MQTSNRELTYNAPVRRYKAFPGAFMVLGYKYTTMIQTRLKTAYNAFYGHMLFSLRISDYSIKFS